MTDHGHMGTGGKVGASNPLPGTILFWDPINGNFNSSIENTMPHALIDAGGWVYVGQFVCGERNAEMYLSPLNIRGEKTVWKDEPISTGRRVNRRNMPHPKPRWEPASSGAWAS